MYLKILNIALCVVLVTILWNCDLGSCSQNGDDVTENITLSFGPKTLDELKNNSNFIAAYGKIPSFGSLEERKQWLNKLDEVYTGTNAEMSKYMYPNGPVTRYGYSINGVLEVAVNETIEKSLMDEIYKISDSKASKMGIKEIPLVFVHGDLAVPVVGEAVPIVETVNSSTSEEKNAVELNNSINNNPKLNNENSSNIDKSGENKSNKNNSVPGFGLLGSLTCLYGGWKFRKK
jgi:hypothetical protein